MDGAAVGADTSGDSCHPGEVLQESCLSKETTAGRTP